MRSVRTISSSGITCAGLKKCAPTTLSAACVFLLMRLRSMVLVLLERMQSGRQAASRSANMDCLRSTRSTAASITMSTYTAFGKDGTLVIDALSCCLNHPVNLPAPPWQNNTAVNGGSNAGLLCFAPQFALALALLQVPKALGSQAAVKLKTERCITCGSLQITSSNATHARCQQ